MLSSFGAAWLAAANPFVAAHPLDGRTARLVTDHRSINKSSGPAKKREVCRTDEKKEILKYILYRSHVRGSHTV